MFLQLLTLVFLQRHILAQGDDFYRSQTAETYCDPLKNKKQYYQLTCRYHQKCAQFYCCQYYFSITLISPDAMD